MKIDGLGQVNYTDAIKTSSDTTDATEFESVLKKAYDEGDKQKLKEACDGFESIMLQSLFKQMKATVPTSSLVEKSTARSMFEDMFDEELMKEATKQGVGISDMMYKQLSKQMENAYKYEKVVADASQAVLQEAETVDSATEVTDEEIVDDVEIDS